MERGEIWAFGDLSIRANGDKSVFTAFFGVLVDETAGVDAGHFGVVEGGDFFEFTGVGVATILRKAGYH